MIVRLWLVAGTLLIGIAWYLTVLLSPPNYQGSARSSIDTYRAAGLMPAAGSLPISKDIGHDVFEVPKTDAAHMGDSPMPGMEMKMPGGGQAKMPGMTAEKMPGMEMKMPGGDQAKMPGMTTEKMPGMEMKMPGGGDHAKMPAMPKMAEEKGHGGEAEEAKKAEEAEGGHGGGGDGGLEILTSDSVQKIDRTVDIKMSEWGYKPGNITVKQGEVIRLVVSNAGNTPHEFMVMTGPAMNAVGYRANRADWNLTEHEAIYEKPLVMPGDSFELVLKIEKPGMWMFMCMFPYHMQLGMMGGLMTEGMEGMMMNMGGMKM